MTHFDLETRRALSSSANGLHSYLRFAIIALLTGISLGKTATCCASDVEAQLTTAEGKARAGELDGAMQQLEPLLKEVDIEPQLKQRVVELATHVLQLRGEEHFRRARIAESIADFDRQIKLQPDFAPGHWQRGIAYYYAKEYEKGAQQFELHQTVNPQDVENAVWHFLCVVRTPKGSVEIRLERN